jgi:uncharacterized protein YjeT (DUF2065 family)
VRALALVACSGFATYLIVLGLLALVDPNRAFRFLRQFAQTKRANAIEAGCRIAVGLGFVVLAPALPARHVFLAFGSVLIVSAVAMLALPGVHRRFADRAVPAIERFIRPIGLVALGAGSLLVAVLWPLIAPGASPY